MKLSLKKLQEPHSQKYKSPAMQSYQNTMQKFVNAIDVSRYFFTITIEPMH